MGEIGGFIDVFPYLAVNTQMCKIRFLGYILPLTRVEFEILRALAFSDGALDRRAIVDCASENIKISPRSISVHICSINKKARDIGGRNLVVMLRDKGYLFEKYP